MFLPTNLEDATKKLAYLFQKTSDELSAERDKWYRYYQLYNNYVDEEQYPLPFKIFMPLVYNAVETKIPRFVNGILYKDPMVQVSRAHPITPMENVESVSRLLNNKWMTDERTYRDLVMMYKEAMFYGTSFAFVEFVKKRRIMTQKVPLPGSQGLYSTIKQQVLVENRPRLQHFDLFNCTPDTRYFHLDDCEFFFMDTVVDFDELANGPIKYDNLDALLELGNWAEGLQVNYKRERLSRVNKMYLPDPMVEASDFFQPRHIIQCVVRQHTNEGETIRLLTIGNKMIPIRNVVLNYWPIIRLTNIPQPHEFLGLSEAFSVERLQYGINDMVNIQMTNMLMALTKMYIVGDGADADLDQFVLEPFNIIQVADIEQVKALEFGGLDGSGDRMYELLNGAFDKTTGVHDYMRGATPPRKEVATTVLSLQTAAEAPIDAQTKWSERECVSQIARTFIECAQNNLDEPENVPSRDGSDFDRYDLNNIQGFYDYRIHGVSAGLNELKRGAIMDFSQAVGQLLGQQMPMDLRAELACQIANNTEGLDGVVEILENFKQSLQAAASQGPVSQAPNNPGNGGMASPNGQGAPSPVTLTQGAPYPQNV